MPVFGDWIQDPDLEVTDELAPVGNICVVATGVQSGTHDPFPYATALQVTLPAVSRPDPSILWSTTWPFTVPPTRQAQSQANYIWFPAPGLAVTFDDPELPPGAIGFEWEFGTGVGVASEVSVEFSLFAHRAASLDIDGAMLNETFSGASLRRIPATDAVMPTAFQPADIALMDELQAFTGLTDLVYAGSDLSESDELAASVTVQTGQGILVIDLEQLAGALPDDAEPDSRAGLIYLGSDGNLSAEDFNTLVSGLVTPPRYRFLFPSGPYPLRQRQRLVRGLTVRQGQSFRPVRQDRTW